MIHSHKEVKGRRGFSLGTLLLGALGTTAILAGASTVLKPNYNVTNLSDVLSSNSVYDIAESNYSGIFLSDVQIHFPHPSYKYDSHNNQVIVSGTANIQDCPVYGLVRYYCNKKTENVTVRLQENQGLQYLIKNLSY